MRDVRYTALKMAIETRWPGSLVVWEPYSSPDDPLIQGWAHILHVREGEHNAVNRFASDLQDRLFPSPRLFFIWSVMPGDERAMLRQLGLSPRRGRSRTRLARRSRVARTPRRGERARTPA